MFRFTSAWEIERGRGGERLNVLWSFRGLALNSPCKIYCALFLSPFVDNGEAEDRIINAWARRIPPLCFSLATRGCVLEINCLRESTRLGHRASERGRGSSVYVGRGENHDVQ